MNSKDFNKWVHNFGQFSGYAIIAMMVAVPIITSMTFKCWPHFAEIWPGLISVAMIYVGPTVSECLAYPPMIGFGSIYMAYISGNTTALKLPVALSALNMAGVRQGTDEAESVSLVVVGISAITVTMVLIIGMIAGSAMTDVLNNPILAPAFSNITPAIFGTLWGMFFLGSEKYFLFAFAVAFILGKIVGMASSYYMLVTILLTVAFGYFLLKKKRKVSTND